MKEFDDTHKYNTNTTGQEKCHIQIEQLKGKEHAFANGKMAANKWATSASYQEMKDALPRPNVNHDYNYFTFMRSIFFRSIEKICPDEAQNFKLVNNEAFLNGWREGVIAIWHYQNGDVEDSRLS